MPLGHSPSVFISSTCYDLAQIRQDLSIFIESLGMTPILSETPSFPIDPNIDAVANCLACVKNRADIFVLIVGGRYGSVDDGGCSITNLEYNEAKAKAIPRYVFVQKQILSILPVWENNKSGDFKNVVDSHALFEFVLTLKAPNENWIFPFETAQDIVATLRKQVSYLLKDALDIRLKLTPVDNELALLELSNAAAHLIINKPTGWEYLLFGQVLSDEVARYGYAKCDYNYEVCLGRPVPLSDYEKVFEWIQIKIDELSSLNITAVKLVNNALQDAIGAPGEPGDAARIVYVARRLGDVYLRIVDWSSEFRYVKTNEAFSETLGLCSKMSYNIITEIEEFSSDLQKKIPNALSLYARTMVPQSVEITLTTTCPDIQPKLSEALTELAKRLGLTSDATDSN